MLTIQLYGLAEHPKTQLLKISLLDALVELPLAFSFVQISTIDDFLEQQLPEVPCLMVNGMLIPSEQTQSVEELSEILQRLAEQPTEDLLSPPLLSATKEGPLPPRDKTDTPNTVKRRKRKSAPLKVKSRSKAAPKPNAASSGNNKPRFSR